MSLEKAKEEFENCSGVQNAYIKQDKLFIKWFANPSNYSQLTREIKNKYLLTQVDKNTDSSGHITAVYKTD